MGIQKSSRTVLYRLILTNIKNNTVWCKERRLFSIGSIRQATQKVIYRRKLTDQGTTNKFPFLLVFPITAFGLGTWQIQRRQWKLDLIQKMKEKTTAEPVPFPMYTDVKELEKLEYNRVNVRGRFDHSKELYVYPKQPLNIPQFEGGGGMISVPSSSGAQIITPFQLSDTKKWVLVNRGWVPRNKMNPKTRLQGQIEEEVQISAVVRKSEKIPSIGPQNDPKSNHWIYKDLEAMSKVTGTDPVLLDATYETTLPYGPLGGQTSVTIRNQHLNYIITWYSLCLLTSVMCYRRYWMKR